METKLNLISEMSKSDKKLRFKTLIHLVNAKNLHECFYMLSKNKAAGIDGVDFRTYEENLQSNIDNLVQRMKRMSYRPQAVKRVFIPKADGGQRGLGIPCLEDKIVQLCFSRILEAIYDHNFKSYSFGFRKGKSCHHALKRLDQMIMNYPVNFVLDADIKGFFDNVNHRKLIQLLELRIADQRFLRYVSRILKSGVIENTVFSRVVKGTPQGGIISPILANIYLHHALDNWFDNQVRCAVTGYVGIVRYADDFIICCERSNDARSIVTSLQKRLMKYDLELSAEKTHVVKFGKYWYRDWLNGGKKPGTFNFLGITHYCGKSRNGNFILGRRTEAKRFRKGLNSLYGYMKVHRCISIVEVWKMVSQKLEGHYRYFGISGNSRRLNQFHRIAEQILYKWLNRRSQKRSFTWANFQVYLKRYPLPRPKIRVNLYAVAWK
jgi:RNA-directed DNA polymerase